MDFTEAFVDDISGAPLNAELVRQARAEELKHFKQHAVYKKVSLEECKMRTGKGPIGSMWLDINKGDESSPEYRSRFVAKEVNTHAAEEMFAATPPLEAKKVLFSLAASQPATTNSLKLMFVDVKRAFFYARARRDVYVKLPPEDATPGMCGKLLKAMYGTRDAPALWEDDYSNKLKAKGFIQGRASPCVFVHSLYNLKLVVHGDDFTFLGDSSALAFAEACMRQLYDIKVRGVLGPDPNDDKEIRILNRILTWSADGLHYECDPRHAEIIVHDLFHDISKGPRITSPGVKNKPPEDLTEDPELQPAEATRYRRLVARANYMALDRCDIQYAVKELSRGMSTPRASHWKALLRLGKFLQQYPRFVNDFHWQQPTTVVHTFVDSDWAGEEPGRKSTSGGAMQLGTHLIKTWASTQNVVALSSGEAELYAILKGATQSIGLKHIMQDLGLNSKLRVFTDSTSGKSIASRRGLGRVRHIDVSNLWIQNEVQSGRIDLVKLKNRFNSADAFTKHLSFQELVECFTPLGCRHASGRHNLAPELSAGNVAGSIVDIVASSL